MAIKLKLDLTTAEFRRLEMAAARQPMSVESLVSKLSRQFIVESENLGARVTGAWDRLPSS